MKDNSKIITLKMIADDMEEDSIYFEGQPFNGKNVAIYLGRHGAAIAALANIVKLIIVEKESK